MTDIERSPEQQDTEEGETADVSSGNGHASMEHPSPETVAAFGELLDFLKRSRGLDLRGYKPASLMRRINKRMATVNVTDFAAFEEYLETHPEEFPELFSELLINVTGFFRDGDAWNALASQVVAPLLEQKGSGRIRLWSAGCATGEEAYTLAMVFAEAMGVEAFKARVKIYATDADESALSQARAGLYEEGRTKGIPAELRDRYFERTKDGRFAFRTDLRRTLIFGKHDLMYDAPISRIDILACRNVLMYFNAETQSRILSRFAIALNRAGVLFLGRAETLLSRTTLFQPLDLKRRLFVSSGSMSVQDRHFAVSSDHVRNVAAGSGALPIRSRDAAFDAGPVAQVVVDTGGNMVLANAQARTLLGIVPQDLGRPLQDFEFSYRPLELRSRVDELYRTQQAVAVHGVGWSGAGSAAATFDVQFAPLVDEVGTFVGVGISFVDTSKHSRLQRELEFAHQSLETAYEELQSTNEELETTNEELQSTVEELETTNEELQSTNEELETMNEELQSTNEELQSINEVMRSREEDLDEAGAFLRSILASLRGGVIALDRELRVTAWNGMSTEQWGLRPEEVMHRGFFTLDIGLPAESLHVPIRACLSGESTGARLEIDATNRRGKPMRVEVTCLPLRRDSGVFGILLMIEDPDAQTLD